MNGWVPTVFVREDSKTYRAVILWVHDKNGGEWKWDVYQRPSRSPQPFGHGMVPHRSGVARTVDEAAAACDAIIGPAEKTNAPSDVFGLVPVRGEMRTPAFTTEAAARSAAKALDTNPRSTDVPAVGIARYQLQEIRPV